MPGKIVCVRFGEGELEGLDQLVLDMDTNRSDAIRRAVGLMLMRSTEVMLDKARVAELDKAERMTHDNPDLPETSSPGRSEPGTVPPPAVPGLPSLVPPDPANPEDDDELVVHLPFDPGLPPPDSEAAPFGACGFALKPSRSQQRRIAAQCGESVPEFGVGHDRGAGGHLQSTSDPCPIPTNPPPVITAEGTITPSVAEIDTSEMTADELDAWMDKVLKP